MNTKASVTMVLVCAALALAACDRPDPRVDELQTEFEQLQNEVGRLEFRVYQLEHPDGTAEEAGAPESPE